MLENGEVLETELDLLVAALKHMPTIRKEKGYQAEAAYRQQLATYFRLNHDMQNTFVFDELLRLASMPAGSLKGRKQSDLDRLCNLTNGDLFLYGGSRCIFRAHVSEGEFGDYILPDVRYTSISYELEEHRGTRAQMTLDEAWSALTDGRLVLGGR